MTDLEAIAIRRSRRAYRPVPLADDLVSRLQILIADINQAANLHFQLIINDHRAFGGFSRTYGLFQDVQHFILVCGRHSEHLFERLGFYGERLVLEAIKMGLGTCWVGGSFDKAGLQHYAADDETLYGVITVGHVTEHWTVRERVIAGLAHRRRGKTIEEMYQADGPCPDWFIRGMQALQKAPSSVHGQPVVVAWQAGRVTASVPALRPAQLVDLGIAMLHFAIGCGGGTWEIRNGGQFCPDWKTSVV